MNQITSPEIDEIATKIQAKISELNILLREAAGLGLRVEIDHHDLAMTGQPVGYLVVYPTFDIPLHYPSHQQLPLS